MKFIMLGAPGAGKGTQAEILAGKLNIPTISTGTILREAMKNGTEVGLKAKAYVESGKLVSDEVIIGIVRERLDNPDCAGGYILDGMPRTIAQAEALEQSGIMFDHVISLEIDDEVIEKRLTGRRTCAKCGGVYHVVTNPTKKDNVCDACGGEVTTRKDDAPETVKARLEVYHQETEPLKEFYEKRGVLQTINGDQSIENATKDILEVLGV